MAALEPYSETAIQPNSMLQSPLLADAHPCLNNTRHIPPHAVHSAPGTQLPTPRHPSAATSLHTCAESCSQDMQPTCSSNLRVSSSILFAAASVVSSHTRMLSTPTRELHSHGTSTQCRWRQPWGQQLRISAWQPLVKMQSTCICCKTMQTCITKQPAKSSTHRPVQHANALQSPMQHASSTASTPPHKLGLPVSHTAFT